MLIEWNEELVTGVKTMDEQHKALVEMLKETYAMLKEGKKQEACDHLINSLLNYLETHLKSEEEFLRSINYPDFENHKRVHDNFRREISLFKERLECGDERVMRELLAMVWGWLFNHIAKTDKKYGLFVRSSSKG